MSVLKFVGARSDINRIISGEIDMPLTAAILKKELVEVHAIINDKDDLKQILKDAEEPLNIKFMMDPNEINKPIYSTKIDEYSKFFKTRSIILGENSKLESSISLNYSLTRKGELELSGRFEKNFKKNETITENWMSIFAQNQIESNSKFLIPKSNSIVLNDSYLFSKSGGNPGFFNLTQLFKAIMPKASSEEFQITIITADCDWSPTVASGKFDKLLAFLNAEFEYSIFLELVIWGRSKSENHKRILVSNYYSVIADCGFDLFNTENKTSNTNDVVVKRIFHDVNQPGDSPYHQSNFRLDLMRKTYNAAKDFCRNTHPLTGCIYLNNGDFENQNRLF